MKALLLGYGDIAGRVAQRLLQQHWQVVGVCRHPERKPTPPAGLDLRAADASNEAELKALLAEAYDVIVITLTPAGRDEDSYHRGYVVPCRHLQHVLSQQQRPTAELPRIIYVSSTGVYGERDGAWLDEESPAEPDTHNGHMLLQAEQVIASVATQVSILRCSGIYGPDRTAMLQRIKNLQATITPAWSNRIHAEDVAGFIAYLCQHPEQMQPLFIVSDNEPVQQQQLYQWYAEQLGVNWQLLPRSDQVGSRGSKRLRNQRMLATGYSLHYPNYRHATINT